MFQYLRLPNPVISYKTLQRTIGILGMLLPVICFFGGWLIEGFKLQSSISAYYYTNVQDVLEGVLIAVSVVLISYRGYERIDSIITSIAGIAAMGIALFPTFGDVIKTGFFRINPETSSHIHVVFAISFFVLMAINSIFLFTLTDKTKEPTKNKLRRNRIYMTSGIVILLSLGLIALFRSSYIVFIFETILLEAFGISWIVKSGLVLKDTITK